MCKLQRVHVCSSLSCGPERNCWGKRSIRALVLEEPPDSSKPDLYFFFGCAVSLLLHGGFL